MDWREELSGFLDTAKQPLVVILGPTASGKTDFSLQIAEALAAAGRRGEVVNADSRQLYRDLDIGTAKIAPDEMRGVPHHLLDVLDARDPVSIAWYKEQAVNHIDRIQIAQGVPLLVGGSMLYISSIIDGLEPLPAVDADMRSALEAEYDRDGGESLFSRLQELDPVLAAGMDPKNKRYVVRALELMEATGKTITEQRTTSICPYELFILGMQWPREALVERINARTDALFEKGWVEEVSRLRERGYTAADPALQSHGYREVLSWIDEGKPPSGFAPLKERIAQNTRNYAKRQMTWWKHDPRIRWIDGLTGDLSSPGAQEEAL